MSKIELICLGGQDEKQKCCQLLVIDGDIYVINVGIATPAQTTLGVQKIIPDFSYLFEEDEYKNGLTWRLQELLENGYLFVTINFLNAIKDDYEEDFDFEAKEYKIKYKIKKGHHIYMSGY